MLDVLIMQADIKFCFFKEADREIARFNGDPL